MVGCVQVLDRHGGWCQGTAREAILDSRGGEDDGIQDTVSELPRGASSSVVTGMNVHTAQRRRMPTCGCADFGGGWLLCQDAEGVFYFNLDGSPIGKWTESPLVMASGV